MTPRFDPTRSIIVDLSRGQLRDDEGAARLNLPAHLFLRLLEHAGSEGTQDFAHALGTDIGRRITACLGESLEGASTEEWVEHLGGQLALVGLGDLTVERWGKALILRVTGTPPAMASLLASTLTGAVERALGRSLALVPFQAEESVAFLTVTPNVALKVRKMVEDGVGLGEAVDHLHQGAA